MLRWSWPISEYNLKTRDSRKQTPRRVTCCGGNKEGADLKNNSQSTTHIDPKVGTGGKPHVLTCLSDSKQALLRIRPIELIASESVPEGREKSGTCLQCV